MQYLVFEPCASGNGSAVLVGRSGSDDESGDVISSSFDDFNEGFDQVADSFKGGEGPYLGDNFSAF